MASSDSKNIQIKFGGDLHQIDVDLLIESLVSYSSVTQEASAYLSPGIKVDIKIKAPESGSFIVLLDLIANNADSLITRESVALTAEIVAIVGGLYQFKKWISKFGKPETIKSVDGQSIEVSNNKGNITISSNVYSIYQENPKVRENLRNTFSKLKEREEITSYSIRDVGEGKDIFNADKSEFESLSSDDDEIEQRKQKVLKEEQELSVFKIVFKENYKWEFFYLGTKVYASLKDEEFFKKIQNGEIAFRSGDKLIVDLEIGQVFNEPANTFVNESYNILKVREHMPRISATQPSFNFENESDD
jgi:hypothetical protein